MLLFISTLDLYHSLELDIYIQVFFPIYVEYAHRHYLFKHPSVIMTSIIACQNPHSNTCKKNNNNKTPYTFPLYLQASDKIVLGSLE